jgi:hypothetical protein
MGCPDKSQIEQLVAGALSENSSKELLSHLNECSHCRQEAAFLTAVRLSLPAKQPGPQCLSDESLSLLRDDLLEGPDREKALVHLSGCQHCLGAWLALDRSLEEAAREPVLAPAHLVKQAVALGAKGIKTEKVSFLQRLLGPSPVWRLSLAGAAAALVLVVAVVLTSPPTRVDVPTGPEPPVLVSDVTGPEEPPAVHPQEPPVEPVSPEPKPSVEQPQKARDWLAALPDQKRLELISSLKPKADLPRVEMGKAYKVPDRKPSIADGYQLGRQLGYLLTFAEQLDSPGVRAQLADAAGSLAPMLRAVAPEKGSKQLVKFARDLETGLSSRLAPDTARVKLEVFKTALFDTVPAGESAGLGFELGLLASQLEVASTAQKLGYQPPRRSFPSRQAVLRVRTMVRKVKDLPDKEKKDVLTSLERIEQMTPAPDEPARASKILEEIHTIDRNVRATR